MVTSATELAQQVQRLLVGEEWRPLSSTQRVAGSAVELQRLLNVGGGVRTCFAAHGIVIPCLIAYSPVPVLVACARVRAVCSMLL